jgi:hypothetical protein
MLGLASHAKKTRDIQFLFVIYQKKEKYERTSLNRFFFRQIQFTDTSYHILEEKIIFLTTY